VDDEALRVTHEEIIDTDLSIDAVNDTLHRTLTQLSPFGVGNGKPLFRFAGVTPLRVTTFGKTGNHTKLTFRGVRGSIDAIAFFRTPESFTSQLGSEPVDVIGHVERSYFMGRPELRIRIVDIV
jgi:single-stranded-DNA-specific exonuclease